MSGLIARRSIIGGLIGLVAAPAIVRADNLMRVVRVPQLYRWTVVASGQGGKPFSIRVEAYSADELFTRIDAELLRAAS